MFTILLALCLTLPGGMARADTVDWASLSEDQVSEITASVTNDLYHEMGHALIDLMDLPVLGNEEDAADIMSVFLINAIWEDGPAEQVMRASLATWSAIAAENAGGEPDWWDEHGPDRKRIATMACLFYGANPEGRAAFAKDLEIPEERAESCADDYAQAERSWGAFFQELVDAGPGKTMVWDEPEEETPLTEAIRSEVDYFNSILSLPREMHVRVAPCGEANAFYDPAEPAITICAESALQVVDRLR